jgi:hypothetical protein
LPEIAVERRREYRLFVEVPGSYQATGTPPREMVFGAISAHGCRLDRIEPNIGVGDVIAVNLGPIGPLKATIRWRSGEAAGVEFHEALECAVVDFFAIYCGTAA